MSAPDLQRTFTGDIPRLYDTLLGPAWFGPVASDLGRRLPVDPGGDVLELACGTGLQTKVLRERLDPGRRLVATDLNAPMLEYARAKLAGLDITWREADAGNLPFGDGEFAAVACSLGIMFLPDKKVFMSEARRVLKPGGLLLFNVWDSAEHNPCVRTYGEVIESMWPGDAEIRFRAPYIMHDTDMLKELVAGGGFRLRKLEKVPIRIEGVTARQIATGQVRGTPRGVLLLKRGADLDQVIDRVTAALEKVGGGENFRAEGRVIAIEAIAA